MQLLPATRPFRIFRVVFAKELRELLRDRKTLFWLFAPPIIFPAIALLAAFFIGSQTVRYVTEGFPISVINAQAAPGLMAKFEKSPVLIVTVANSEAESTANALISIRIPDGFQSRIDSGQQVQIDLIRRDNSFVTTLALGALRSEVESYNASVVDTRLKDKRVGREWLSPVAINEGQAASVATSVTATSGSTPAPGLGALFLPLAITSWVIGGGLGLIVDSTVGEKERQTIESLLVTPASRIGIVLGKMTVVFVASLLVMGLWMVEGVFLSLVADVGPKLGGLPAPDASALIGQSIGSLGWLVLVLIVLLIPFVILLNSLVMIFCSFASSYRESNTFLFLIQLILPALVLLSVFALGPDSGDGWFAVPLLGTIISIRDLFSQSLSSLHFGLAVGSAGVYAIGALFLASYTYSRNWS